MTDSGSDGPDITADADAARVRLPPPAVFITALATAVLLQRFVLQLPLGLPRTWRLAVALAAALFGLGLMALAALAFRRTGQDPRPWKPTPELLRRGVYSRTRNPMYAGMALLLAGAGLKLDNGWALLFLPLILYTLYRTAIRPEEEYLERKFGDAYRSYKQATRRWI